MCFNLVLTSTADISEITVTFWHVSWICDAEWEITEPTRKPTYVNWKYWKTNHLPFGHVIGPPWHIVARNCSSFSIISFWCCISMILFYCRHDFGWVFTVWQFFFPINSLNTGAFVRVAGRLQLGTRPVWLMWMSVTYLTNLVPPTLSFPATTPRVPSTVEPVLLVTLDNTTHAGLLFWMQNAGVG